MDVLKTINKLLVEQGRTQVELCQHLGLRKQTFTDWKNGKSKTYLQFLPQIAAFFGVSVNDLYEEEPDKHVQIEIRPGRVRVALKEPSEREILKLYRGSSPEARAFARQILEKSVEVETPVSAEVVDRPVSPIVAVKRDSILGEVSSKRGGGVKVKLREGKKGGKGWK